MANGIATTPRPKIDPEKWDRLKGILDEALQETSARTRAAVVKRLCGDDALLLREAESLLTAAESIKEQPSDWLENGAEQATATFWDDDLSRDGERVGNYVIVRQLGRGGMGAVYLAARADGEFEKEVAIKLLKRGTDTDEILRRFRTERQIVARLDHANIARLLDAGTTHDGLPYFVMEYVAGVPVTRFVREQNLTIEERLRLFLKICRAVEVAHKAAVVHRDLKPGNILIAADGEPKLLDFGIAKLLADGEAAEIHTVTGRQPLTPHSASPEQLRGESVTAATDVYALGALLYEMLAGRTPHRFSAAHPPREEVLRVICEEEVIPPSRVVSPPALRRQLQGDLDNITLHALRKESRLRYPTVAEFAEDIRRHLAGDLVRARPATIRYRIQRFVARNRLLTARSLAVGAGLLALGGAAATLLTFGLKTERPSSDPIATQNSEQSLPEKSIAVLPFQNLSAEAENAFFAAGVQDAILTDLTKIADLKVINRTSVQQYGTDAPRDLGKISQQLRVAYLLEGSVQRAGNRVRVTAKLTDARTNAQAWAQHYDRELADVFGIQSEIAQKIADQLQAAISPREKAALHLTATRDMVAYDLYLRAKDIDRSVGAAREQTERQVALLDQAVARDAQFVPALSLLARTHLKAYVLGFDRTAERLELAKRALAAASAVAPDSGEVHLAHGVLLYWGNRDYEGALAKLKQARHGLPNDADVSFFIGLIERRRGNWDECIRYMREATSLDPFDANALLELGNTYGSLRRYDEAAAVLDRLLIGRENDFTYLSARASLESSAKGDLTLYEQLLTSEAARNADPEILKEMTVGLALMKRDYATAANLLASDGPQEARSADAALMREWTRALLAGATGNPDDAQKALQRAREAALQAVPTGRNDGAWAMMMVAEIDARMGNTDEARRIAEETMRKPALTNDVPARTELLVRLAGVYSWVGDKERAFEILEQTAEMPFGPTYGSLLFDDIWEPLREEPRFERLLRSLAPKPSTR